MRWTFSPPGQLVFSCTILISIKCSSLHQVHEHPYHSYLFHVHTPEQSSSIQPNLPSSCLSMVVFDCVFITDSPFNIKNLISKTTKALHARCGRLRYDTLIKALNMDWFVSSHLVFCGFWNLLFMLESLVPTVFFCTALECWMWWSCH